MSRAAGVQHGLSTVGCRSCWCCCWGKEETEYYGVHRLLTIEPPQIGDPLFARLPSFCLSQLSIHRLAAKHQPQQHRQLFFADGTLSPACSAFVARLCLNLESLERRETEGPAGVGWLLQSSGRFVSCCWYPLMNWCCVLDTFPTTPAAIGILFHICHSIVALLGTAERQQLWVAGSSRLIHSA